MFHVSVRKGVCVEFKFNSCNMEFDFSDENDIYWLTQESSNESDNANFNITGGDGDDLSYLFGESSGSNIVSLEEDNGNSGSANGMVLYDNVVAEDISSDDEIDQI